MQTRSFFDSFQTVYWMLDYIVSKFKTEKYAPYAREKKPYVLMREWTKGIIRTPQCSYLPLWLILFDKQRRPKRDWHKGITGTVRIGETIMSGARPVWRIPYLTSSYTRWHNSSHFLRCSAVSVLRPSTFNNFAKINRTFWKASRTRKRKGFLDLGGVRLRFLTSSDSRRVLCIEMIPRPR